MSKKAKTPGLFDPTIIRTAALDALRKLDPRKLAKNPVIFVTEVVSLVVTGFFVRDCVTGEVSPLFSGQIAFWLWFTVLFANFAEAVAEGRGKAQADTLRRTKQETVARRLVGWQPGQADTREEEVPGTGLTLGDFVVVEAGQIIPGDGDVV